MSDRDPNTRDVGGEVESDVKRSAQRLSDDAKKTADDLGRRARDEANAQADRAKEGVATEISSIADALRKAADEMRSGSPQERTFGQIAEGLADASEAIHGRDVGELAREASDFARRNPLAFLGGAALAGFAVTRFAKASTKPRPSRGGSGSSSDLPSSDSDRDSPTGSTGPDRDGPTPATTGTDESDHLAAPATVTSPSDTKTPGGY